MTSPHVPSHRPSGVVRSFLSYGSSVSGRERRQHRRYPIAVESEYIVKEERARTTTLDISTGGVLLKTNQRLPEGIPIQVLIDWPVLLDQRCPLRLVIGGIVLRSDARGTVVGIDRHDFRLRPTRGTEVFVA